MLITLVGSNSPFNRNPHSSHNLLLGLSTRLGHLKDSVLDTGSKAGPLQNIPVLDLASLKHFSTTKRPICFAHRKANRHDSSTTEGKCVFYLYKLYMGFLLPAGGVAFRVGSKGKGMTSWAPQTGGGHLPSKILQTN